MVKAIYTSLTEYNFGLYKVCASYRMMLDVKGVTKKLPLFYGMSGIDRKPGGENLLCVLISSTIRLNKKFTRVANFKANKRYTGKVCINVWTFLALVV